MRAALSTGLWLVTVGHLVIETCSGFLPVLYPVLISQMGLTFTQVGVLALVATTATTLAQPLFGYVSDRWGADRLTGFGIVWIGVMMGLVGFAGTYSLLLVFIALGSLGSAAFHPAAATIAATHSGANRGAGLSLFSVGGNIGVALSPLWIGLTLTTVGTAGTGVFIPLGIVTGVVTYALLRRLHRRAEMQPKLVSRGTHAGRGFMTGLLLVVAAMMFRSWFQVSLGTYLPTWVEQHGGSVALGGRVLAIMLFAASVGSLIGGPIGDRIGHWQVVLGASVVMPLALWFFLEGSGWQQMAWLIVVGIAIGTTYPTSIVLALESWPHQVGLASALVMGVGWWPGGIGASVTGYLADQYSLAVGLQSLLLAPFLTIICILVFAGLRRQHEAWLSQPSNP